MNFQSNSTVVSAGIATRLGFGGALALHSLASGHQVASFNSHSQDVSSFLGANPFAILEESSSVQTNFRPVTVTVAAKKAVTRWSNTLERRFEMLSFKRANGACTETEDEELNELISTRNQLTSSRTAEEIFHDARKQKLLSEMDDVFRRYTTFLNERKNHQTYSSEVRIEAT